MEKEHWKCVEQTYIPLHWVVMTEYGP